MVRLALNGVVGTCSTAAVGRMKIVVDRDECEANAVCVGILPDVFEVDDDDNLILHAEYPPDEQLGKVREAVDSCPKRALALRVVEEGEVEL
jgi:ferredoxin